MYPGNTVCFRYIIVKTLHKSDNTDNNNTNSVTYSQKTKCISTANTCQLMFAEIMLVNLKLLRNLIQAVKVKLH
jgi:hypothetical protein